MSFRFKFSSSALAAAALLAPLVHVPAQDAVQPARVERARRVGVAPASSPPLAVPKGRYQGDESVRSDKFTGGRIERARFAAGEPDIRVTVDVPAFRLTLWQNGKEVKTYRVGVGKLDYPITISERKVSELVWNPDWIPPNSDWVVGRKGVKPGEVIKPTDPRNPLGKMKIPLGSGYLIHEATGLGDLGSLVSHGCIRMLRADLYDLAEKIVAARQLPVTAKRIAAAKRTKKTLVAKLDEPLVVDINYDTQVVEGGALHLYADFYNRGTNTAAHLRAELEESGFDPAALDDATIKRLLARPTQRQKFVVKLESLAAGRALAEGRSIPVLGGAPAATPARKKPAAKKTARSA
ncbi:MAG TPA: L,D-transpeptidase [Pyrinomonadaceae bacterium]|nr:L,D-transpeptidase [Pyrinomonadaceae bacterium]